MESQDVSVNVKTLDSLTHPFSVKSTLTVKQFKAVIEPTVNVAADQQRLIYCGKVLADDKNLKDYDIHGKTIHLVIRPPPSASHPEDSSTTGPSSDSGRRSAPPGSTPVNGSQFLGAVYQFDGMNFGQIVQDVISNLGDLGRNATVTSATSDDGSAVDVHINLGQVSSQTATNQEVQYRVSSIRSLLTAITRDLQDLEQNRAPPANLATSSMDQSSQRSVPVMPETVAETPAFSATEAAITAAQGAAAAASQAEAAAALARQAAAAVAASIYGGQSVMPHIVIRAPGVPNTVSSNPAEQVTAPPTSTNLPLRGSTITRMPTTVSGPEAPPVRQVSSFTSAEFADLLQSVRELETRSRAHFTSLESNLRDSSQSQGETSDAEQSRRHRVLSNVMHQFGHIYYFLSDLFVNFNQPPPRNVGLFGGPLLTPVPPATPTQPRTPRTPRSSSVPRGSVSTSTEVNFIRDPRLLRTQVTVAQAPVLVMEVGTTVRIPGVSATTSQATTPSQTTRPSTASTTNAGLSQGRPPVMPVLRLPVRTPVPVDASARNASARSWESVVPPAWIPVINRDLVRQREELESRSGQQPQQFSEAYLNGLPNKKRKTDGDDDSSSAGGSGGSCPRT